MKTAVDAGRASGIEIVPRTRQAGQPLYASVDVGTNTLRLLIAWVDEAGIVNPVVYKRTIARLGGNYDEAVGIDPAAAERAARALEDFSAVMAANGVTSVTALGTSVIRRARNKDWFLSMIKERSGIEIKAIDGSEEARLALKGVLSVIRDGSEKKLVFDVGGGSTEFIAVTNGSQGSSWSMEMGVVHLMERHIKSDPPTRAELAAMEREIGEVIALLKERMRSDGVEPDGFSRSCGACLIGTAGTVTTLAAIDQGLESYDRTRVDNYVLSKDSIRRIYAELLSMTLSRRAEVLSLEKGREDLIIPGSAITLRVMDAFGFDSVKVSDAGLLEGIIIDGAAALQGEVMDNGR